MQTAMNTVLNGLSIEGNCVRAEVHRHLAFFDIVLATKASALRKLENSAKQIALHLKTKTIPIVRLVPTEGIVRLQVALKNAEPVGLMDLYQGELLPSEMVFPFLLGENDEGKKLWMDMINNPHLLIAGSTGSGKSVLLHNLIANALYVHALRLRNVWIYLGDPKRVEFTDYRSTSLNGIVMNVSSSYEEILEQLEDLVTMMEHRYEMIDRKSTRLNSSHEQ
jgi:S-DNA-T family DNA segregation ATPase FtsK/SpoIIIE